MNDRTNEETVDLGTQADRYPSTATATAAPATATAVPPRRVRIGTIVWGGILLLIAALTFASVFVDSALYGPSLWIWGVIGIGTLLVLAGIIGAIIRGSTGRARKRRDEDIL